MHNDETLWHVLNHDYCSYKVKLQAPKQNFCRNQYNVTGLCNKVSCPLANSQYATVMEDEGISYLYMKTVERAHSPKNLWEKVKLSRNYLQALDQISTNLQYWPEHMINRCKQRLTRVRQMLIRMRKLSMREGPKLVPIKKKTERREATRELKAEAAAKVDLAIENELLERLKQGTYGDIYNFPPKQFDKMLDKNEEIEEELEDESENEFVEDFDDDEDEDDELEGEDLLDVSEAELARLSKELHGLDDLEDLGGASSSKAPPRKKRKGSKASGAPRVEVEYEEEMEAH